MDTHPMQAAAPTEEPSLKAEPGAVSAVSLSRGPHSLQVWGAPWAKSRNILEAKSSTPAEGHRPGQNEGGTAAGKLVKPGAQV